MKYTRRQDFASTRSLVSSLAIALALSACGGQSTTQTPSEPSTSVNATDASDRENRAPASTEGDATPAWPNKSKTAASAQATSPNAWWPERLDLAVLRQNTAMSDPMGDDFDYPKEFATLDIETVKKDLVEVMTTSQDWWPADYGTYGPFFIRMAWHSAGTYRVTDGRGGAGAGQQRFEPLNSWPDNANLDKAQRLLWPLKKKYGRKISWADLMVLAGTVAMESMGFETYGFAGGRVDAWEPDLVYWGPENKFLTDQRHEGDRELKQPFGAAELGLIYVNPQGPNGNPDPLASAKDIRKAFGRMAMNDEETVALIAGGHTFGKTHGAAKPDDCVGPEPAASGVEQQGLGWKNTCGTGNAGDTITSGLEGAWTANPAQWTHQYFTFLMNFEWKQTRSPAGAIQWIPTDEAAAELVPDAHDPAKTHAPIMLTTDMALKFDPAYKKISQRFLDDPAEFELAFAKAWFKLTHRDMGPRARYLGTAAPKDTLSWQDPIPSPDHSLVNDRDIGNLKAAIRASDLSISDRIRTAWASASTFRDTDKRGGANGARLRLAPQKDWSVNDPVKLAETLGMLEEIQATFNDAQTTDKKISVSDLIVLAGATAVEDAAREAGYTISVPFTPGRMDASAEQTDIGSFSVMEPLSDGFRNYLGNGDDYHRSPAEALVDRADLLNLTVPEMTALIGGLRALDANTGGVKYGVLTQRPQTLSNDFFVNLLDNSTEWKASSSPNTYDGFDRATGDLRWTATDVDLVFGANSELRAVAESYAYDGAEEVFINDFVEAWTKVMMLDRFDLG